MCSDRSSAPLGLKIAAAAGLAFLHLPLLLIFVYAFTTEERSYQWPPPGLTLQWFAVTWNRPDVWQALGLSLKVAAISTVIAMILGTLCAAAVSRTRFFGRETISLLVILPIALPGIITGISLLSLFKILGVRLSLEAVIIGHATALLSVVVTQVFARLQRLNRNLEDAAADLGAKPMTVLLLIVLPNIRSAIIGSALLAFTLSFDEIPVTFFLTGRENTLPMYIWSTLRRGITPEINAVASLIMLGSFVLAMISVWLLRDER